VGVYETHDSKRMVAVCPTCHDAVHHGPLNIDDNTVRRWKTIKRSRVRTDHVYVEPGESANLLLGTVAVTGPAGLIVFELGASNRLSFRLVGGDIMLLNLAVSSSSGKELLRVVDGHVRHDTDDQVRYERVPGHIAITSPASDAYLPGWAPEQLREEEPGFAPADRMPVLDLEVLEPGLVQVQGIWHDEGRAVAVTTERLAFLDEGKPRAISLIGGGADSVLRYVGPITTALFELGDGAGVIRIPDSNTRHEVGRNDPCWCGSEKKFKKCHGA
jgi:hypothetical protein